MWPPGYRPRLQGDARPVPSLLCRFYCQRQATSWPPAVRVGMADLAEARAETELPGAGPHLNRLKIAMATRRLARDKL